MLMLSRPRSVGRVTPRRGQSQDASHGAQGDSDRRAGGDRPGGGLAGVHAASDTESDWPCYDRLVGVHFASHPAIQQATIDVADRSHPSTRALPPRWTRTDEWYNFAADPRRRVHVLMLLDE